jgi:hypothetical protein
MQDTRVLATTRQKTLFSTFLCLFLTSCGEFGSNSTLVAGSRDTWNVSKIELGIDSAKLNGSEQRSGDSTVISTGSSNATSIVAGVVGGGEALPLASLSATSATLNLDVPTIPAAPSLTPLAAAINAPIERSQPADQTSSVLVAQVSPESKIGSDANKNEPAPVIPILSPKIPVTGDLSGLLKPENMKLMGRFRVPLGGNGLTSTAYSRGGLTIGNEGTQPSLFVVGSGAGSIAYGGNPNVHIGEIWIPENLSLSNDFNSLPVATFKQPMTNALENQIGDVFAPTTPTAARLEVEVRGLLKVGDKLLVNAVMAYDNNNVSIAGHFSRPADLSVSGNVRGPVRVAPQAGIRHAPGPMFHVPQYLQREYGWPGVATGLNGVSINSTISNGPGTILFSPALIDSAAPRTAIPGVVLSDYPYPNKTFANAMGAKFGMMSFDPLNQNEWWTPVSHTRGGGAWIEKYGTVVFFGFRGMGVPYYGSGLAAPSWAANDPTNSNGAPHAYPYQHVLLLINQAELIKSFKGEQAPHEVKAYSSMVLNDPFWPASQTYQICGSAHDRSTNRLYIRKCRSFDDGQSLVEVFQVN